jgi:cytochrome c oxidase subunit 4
MSDNAHDIHASVKKYLLVFYALLIGTVITVGAYFYHIESVAITVAIALFIASIKGFLVAGYFMHLISEKKMIYAILAATVFFFAGLMYITIWSMDAHSFPNGTIQRGHSTHAGSAHAGSTHSAEAKH